MNQKVILIILIALAILGIAGFLGYKYFQNKIPERTFPVEWATPSPESVDTSNQVIGIQLNKCCSCPEKISEKLIGTDGWTKYKQGKDYTTLRPPSCSGQVACSPCPPPEF